MSSPRFGSPVDAAERADFKTALCQAFATTDDQVEHWLDVAGHENVRVYSPSAGDDVVGGLIVIPMGQFYGGRSVSMVGVAGVAIRVEHRGRGHARAMMAACVRDAAAAGHAVSVLYASTVPLYRSCGWENAGSLFTGKVEARNLPRRRGDAPSPRVATPADHDAMRALDRTRSARHHGHVDRGDYVWYKVTNPRDEHATAFVVDRPGGGIDGYAWIVQRHVDGGWIDVHLTDWCAETPAARDALTALVADQATMGRHVTFAATPGHALLERATDRGPALDLREPWMLRVLDVERALRDRGWPPGLERTIAIDVDDPLLPANRGRFVLRLRGDGTAQVTRGAATHAEPALALDVSALAPLYSGHRSARELAIDGLLTGDDETIDRAQAVFAAASPTMLDFF